jgi:hypothetical protein
MASNILRQELAMKGEPGDELAFGSFCAFHIRLSGDGG